MKTLRELSEHVRAGHSLEIQLGDFLDSFYLDPSPARVQEPPAQLSLANPQGAMMDALLAAVAEYLCRRFSLSIPAWVYEPCRYLERPFFALPSLAFRTTLLLESPMEFRSRNLFVTANALSRASEHASLLTAPQRETTPRT